MPGQVGWLGLGNRDSVAGLSGGIGQIAAAHAVHHAEIWVFAAGAVGRRAYNAATPSSAASARADYWIDPWTHGDEYADASAPEQVGCSGLLEVVHSRWRRASEAKRGTPAAARRPSRSSTVIGGDA